MLRLTGKAVRRDSRSGHSPDKVTGELKPWSFDIITVLVAEQAVVNVQKFASHTDETPAVGSEVDLAVTVDVFRGTPSFQYAGTWESMLPQSAPSPAAVPQRVSA